MKQKNKHGGRKKTVGLTFGHVLANIRRKRVDPCGILLATDYIWLHGLAQDTVKS